MSIIDMIIILFMVIVMVLFKTRIMVIVIVMATFTIIFYCRGYGICYCNDNGYTDGDSYRCNYGVIIELKSYGSRKTYHFEHLLLLSFD